MRTTLTRLFTVMMLIMVSMVAQADVKVLFGEDGKELEPGKDGTITLSQKEVTGGTITITQEKPTDGKVRVNFKVAPASGYTYNDGNITLVAFYPLSSTRADSPAEDITVHSTLTLHPKDESQTDTSKPRNFYVDIDEGLGIWVQKATFGQEKRDDTKKTGTGTVVPNYIDFSGTYYIANFNNGGYDPKDQTNNYYLCPATNNYDDNQPFLTTHKNLDEDDDELFKWIVRPAKTENDIDYYYLIYVSANTEYYLTYNDAPVSNDARIRVHLQSAKDDEKSLFYFERGIKGDKKNYNIYPKSDKRSINPAKANTDDYAGNNTAAASGAGNWGSIQLGGLIGVYGTDDKTGLWYLEDIVETPTVSINSDGKAVISSSDENATYYYTTDGTTKPTTGSGSNQYTGPIDITGIETIKAIAVVNGEVSNVATYTVGNGTPYIIQNQECTAYYLISGDETQTNVPANTSSIYGPKIEWLLKYAGYVNGIQYYYFVNNATKDFLYRTGDKVYVKAFAANDDGFKFNFFTQTDGSYNIYPKDVNIYNKWLYKNNGNASGDEKNKNYNVILHNDLTYASRGQWTFIPTSAVADKRSLFENSPVEGAKYYKIENKNETEEARFIMSPVVSESIEYAGVSDTETNDNMVWRFEEAGHDEWQTYYNIVSATTGKYMYYTGPTNTDTKEKAIEMKETCTDDVRFQFVLARATDDNYYYIIPKTHKDVFKDNKYYGIWLSTEILKTILSRSSNANNVKWKFEETPTFIAPPFITFSADDMKVTMESTTANIDGMKYDYTIGTADAPSDATIVYDGGIEVKYGPIYHFAAKTEKGGNSSILIKKDIDLSYIAVPTISVSGNTVTFTTTQKGMTFYYTTDGSEPKYIKDGDSNNHGTAIDSDSGNAASVVLGNDFFNIRVIAVSIMDDANKTGYSSSPSDVRTVDLRDATIINTLADIQSQTGYFKCSSTFSATGTPKIDGTGDEIGTSSKPFKGTLEGYFDETNKEYKAISLSKPLFDYVEDATIKNIIVAEGTISGTQNGSGNVGAIAGNALGDTRIYNCGFLGSISENEDANGNVSYSYGSSISGDRYVGGIVGFLDGSSRVINCYSYAEITSGTSVGGIVGYNNVATTSINRKTMVMNCMFYGDITGGTSKAPVYNGQPITNRSDGNGVSNFNYFWAGASYVQKNKINVYNCALSAETRFLNRFEFFRHLLNSNRALAAWWATGSYDNKDEMMKWVMEPSQIGTTTPYPILKAPDRYPSVVNIDVNHSETYKGRDMTVGSKLSTLTVKIQNASTGAPVGANINSTSSTLELNLNITDKDPNHFNFNYYKVQLPYYNDVGTNNYRKASDGKSRVVTGWKIVSIASGSKNFSTGSDASASITNGDINLTTPYNFADRKCTDKDLYSASGRVFSQGAYFDVPEGVTSITIEPYWAKCVYVADAYPDVVYDQIMDTASDVTTVGTLNGEARFTNGQSYSINGEGQVVYTTMSDAVDQMPTSGTVYDNAIVLVGNVHSIGLSDAALASDDDKKGRAYTIMSIDMDKDNEPDYSYILRFNDRVRMHPVRIDFLNVIGLGMAQKSKDGSGTYNFGIMQPLGWFECTNTALFRVTQFEYDKKGRVNSPVILQGGVIEQWVTVGGAEDTHQEGKTVSYYHIGGNVWFKEFHIGVHQDKNKVTNNNPNPDQFVSPHPPISVTGGDFDEFYLTGLYNTPNNNFDDNAECYINGGHFGKVAGTGMQGIGGFTMNGSTKEYSNGNIIWQIDNADIDEFYAGGINAAHIAEGNIYTVISNSRVDQFCGGPKFGDMNSDKKVVTNAKNCKFRTFFGAGYGGNSYNRRYPGNKNNVTNINWNNWVSQNDGEDPPKDDGLNYRYSSAYGGVETRIDYQFLPMSGNKLNVARLFVDYVCFSLATSYDVTSKLTGCTITKAKLGKLDISDNDKRLGNFFGGGSLGKVEGPIKSTLINCTVEGNVYGAGYSATVPTVSVMSQSFQTPPRYDANLGAYMEAKLPSTTPYTWEHAETVNSTETAIDTQTSTLYTTVNLDKSNLGSVSGNVTLTLTTSGDGETVIGTGNPNTGNVYGGGDESYVTGSGNKVTVTLSGNTQVLGNVYGGGNKGVVEGRTEVNIKP